MSANDEEHAKCSTFALADWDGCGYYGGLVSRLSSLVSRFSSLVSHLCCLSRGRSAVFHGRDKENHVVIYQKPANVKMEALKAHGLGIEELTSHYCYLEEFIAKG